MDIQENNDMFDLGSAPIDENFDPFAAEEEPEGIANDDLPMQQPEENEAVSVQAEEQPTADTPANTTVAENVPNVPKAKAAKTGYYSRSKLIKQVFRNQSLSKHIT